MRVLTIKGLTDSIFAPIRSIIFIRNCFWAFLLKVITIVLLPTLHGRSFYIDLLTGVSRHLQAFPAKNFRLGNLEA